MNDLYGDIAAEVARIKTELETVKGAIEYKGGTSTGKIANIANEIKAVGMEVDDLGFIRYRNPSRVFCMDDIGIENDVLIPVLSEMFGYDYYDMEDLEFSVEHNASGYRLVAYDKFALTVSFTSPYKSKASELGIVGTEDGKKYGLHWAGATGEIKTYYFKSAKEIERFFKPYGLDRGTRMMQVGQDKITASMVTYINVPEVLQTTGLVTNFPLLEYVEGMETATSLPTEFLMACYSINGDLSFNISSIPNNFMCDCYFFNKNITLKNATQIGDNCWKNCYGMVSFPTFEKVITRMGSECFSFCEAISDAPTFCSNLTTIPAYFMRGCGSLEGDLNLSKATSIGSNFRNDVYVEKLHITLNLKWNNIGGYFYNNSGISELPTGIQSGNINGGLLCGARLLDDIEISGSLYSSTPTSLSGIKGNGHKITFLDSASTSSVFANNSSNVMNYDDIVVEFPVATSLNNYMLKNATGSVKIIAPNAKLIGEDFGRSTAQSLVDEPLTIELVVADNCETKTCFLANDVNRTNVELLMDYGKITVVGSSFLKNAILDEYLFTNIEDAGDNFMIGATFTGTCDFVNLKAMGSSFMNNIHGEVWVENLVNLEKVSGDMFKNTVWHGEIDYSKVKELGTNYGNGETFPDGIYLPNVTTISGQNVFANAVVTGDVNLPALISTRIGLLNGSQVSGSIIMPELTTIYTETYQNNELFCNMTLGGDVQLPKLSYMNNKSTSRPTNIFMSTIINGSVTVGDLDYVSALSFSKGIKGNMTAGRVNNIEQSNLRWKVDGDLTVGFVGAVPTLSGTIGGDVIITDFSTVGGTLSGKTFNNLIVHCNRSASKDGIPIIMGFQNIVVNGNMEFMNEAEDGYLRITGTNAFSGAKIYGDAKFLSSIATDKDTQESLGTHFFYTGYIQGDFYIRFGGYTPEGKSFPIFYWVGSGFMRGCDFDGVIEFGEYDEDGKVTKYSGAWGIEEEFLYECPKFNHDVNLSGMAEVNPRRIGGDFLGKCSSFNSNVISEPYSNSNVSDYDFGTDGEGVLADCTALDHFPFVSISKTGAEYENLIIEFGQGTLSGCTSLGEIYVDVLPSSKYGLGQDGGFMQGCTNLKATFVLYRYGNIGTKYGDFKDCRYPVTIIDKRTSDYWKNAYPGLAYTVTDSSCEAYTEGHKIYAAAAYASSIANKIPNSDVSPYRKIVYMGEPE